jgi:hypothetical protein
MFDRVAWGLETNLAAGDTTVGSTPGSGVACVEPFAAHAQDDQADATLRQVGFDGQQLRRAACQAIRLRDRQDIAVDECSAADTLATPPRRWARAGQAQINLMPGHRLDGGLWFSSRPSTPVDEAQNKREQICRRA